MHRLVRSKDIQHQVHGDHVLGRINARIAVTITNAVGTMWVCYLFILVSLISLPQAWTAFASGDTVTGIAWLSQSFLQLVLLPLLMVGQRVISEAQDARAQADHDTLTLLHQINLHQLEILEAMKSVR